ncbi:MAG: sigma-70 family RNA polymerase sigma factor [Saprospiraceae bacterium]
MQTSQWTDDQFLAAINSGGQNRQTALRVIYGDNELKRKVIQFVRNRQGNADDGQDMFHEGIIVLDRNIRENRFRGEAPLKGYLYSICRFLWMNQLRKQAHTTQGAETVLANEPDEHTPEITMIAQERKDVLNNLLSQLGDRCQRILELWKLSYSMEEIADSLGFSSADMARKAKYRCHLSLVDLVQQNPEMQKALKY